MSVKTIVTYMGELQCSALHEQSGSVIETEAPLDNLGKGTKFSPTDLVGAALASCILTMIGAVADREKVNLKGTKAFLEKEMSANPRRIGKFEIDVVFPKNLEITDVQKRKFENAAKTCPVKGSLHPDIEINLKFTY